MIPPVLLLLLTAAPPAWDEAVPFEYFSATTARLIPVEPPPTPGARLDRGFRVTELGHLAAERGRLAVFLGDPPEPFPARVKGWHDTAQGLFETQTFTGGATVTLQLVSLRTTGIPDDVGLLRVLVRAGPEPAAVVVTVGFVPDAGLAPAWPPHDLDAVYTLGEGHVARDGRLLYNFPELPGRRFLATLDRSGLERFTAPDVQALRRTPLALVQYRVNLPAHRTNALVFRMPARALPVDQVLGPLRRLDFDEQLLLLDRQWESWSETQPRITVADAKVAAAYRQARRRLYAWGQTPPDGPVTPDPALAAAELERGLVVWHSGPDHWLLNLPLSARRARSLLAAGDGEAAVAALYALLLHSSASHEFSDFVPLDWGRRERIQSWGVPYDAATAGEYVRLVEESLARPEGDGLVLLSGLAPSWTTLDRPVVAERLPTPFGPISLRVERRADGLKLTLTETPASPEGLILEVPWYLAPTAITADGEALTVDRRVALPAGCREIEVTAGTEEWPGEPSFAGTVARFAASYREWAVEHAAAGGTFSGAGIWPLPAAERAARFEEAYGDR